jgi:hypothetical protein
VKTHAVLEDDKLRRDLGKNNKEQRAMKTLIKSALAAALAFTMVTATADATVHHSAAWYRAHRMHHHERVCTNRGTAIGVVAGALAGNSMSGHHRVTGTVAGAAVGGVAGHAIGQRVCDRDHH